jgi:hypothetical protein
MLKLSSKGRHNSLKRKQGINAWLARKKKTNAAATMVSLKKGRWQEKDDGVSVSFLGLEKGRRRKCSWWLEATALVWKIGAADWQTGWHQCRCKQLFNGSNMGRRCQLGV